MAFRRRRKPRVVWLPASPIHTLQTQDPGLETGEWAKSVAITLSYGGSAGSTYFLDPEPIVLDPPPELTASTISDIENSGYRLRRVVGSIFVKSDSGVVSLGEPNVAPDAWLVSAGLIILRVTDAGVPLSSFSQVQGAGRIDEVADPYIWHRSWMLGDPTAYFNIQDPVNNGVIPLTFWPFDNTRYGSVREGTHIDAKTARRVGPEERLFLVASATQWNGSENQNNALAGAITIDLKVRCLGTVITSSGNRRNASR